MQLSENAQGQWPGLCRYDLYRTNWTLFSRKLYNYFWL